MSGLSPTDAQLLQASLTGQEKAFAALVDKYKSLICAMAYSATGDLDLSQDIAQETFLVAWRKLRQVTDAGKFRPWLCGIASNFIREALRRRKREQNNAARLLHSASEPQTSCPNPREEAVARERTSLLSEMLGRLPAEYRLPLVLYYYEHHSTKSVAEALNLSEAAVRQRLSRGRKMLQESVLATIDETLSRGRPGKAFTVAVIQALPGTFHVAPAAAQAVQANPTYARLLPFGAVKGIVAGGACFLGVVLVLGTVHALFASADSTNPEGPSVETAQASSPGTGSVALPAPTDQSRPKTTESSTPSVAQPKQDGSTDLPQPESSKDPLETEDVRLARDIVERAARTGTAEFCACLDAWAYLAALGDEASRDRLLDVVRSLDVESGYSIRATLLLLNVVDDSSFIEELFEIAADPARPYDDRKRAVGIVSGLAGRDCAFELPLRPPVAVEDFARYVVQAEGPTKDNMFYLRVLATERTRPFAEAFLLANTSDGGKGNVKRRSSRRGFSFAQESMFGPAEASSSYCVASWSLNILKRIGSPASRDALRHYAAFTTHLDNLPTVARTLCLIGDRDVGLTLLEDCFNDATAPGDRMRCAAMLVDVGQEHYRNEIRKMMSSPDREVRMDAYAWLCRLSDSSFLQAAPRDFGEGGVGAFTDFVMLRDADAFGRNQVAGSPQRIGDPLAEYCLAVADDPPTPQIAMEALRTLLSSSHGREQATLSICHHALTGPVPNPYNADGGKTYLFAVKLCCLVRWGDDATHHEAVERLEVLCQNWPTDGFILNLVRYTQSQSAQPILVQVMKTNPDEMQRVRAACGYLSIECGKTFG